jgi:hypothetical protein
MMADPWDKSTKIIEYIPCCYPVHCLYINLKLTTLYKTLSLLSPALKYFPCLWYLNLSHFSDFQRLLGLSISGDVNPY